jgi:hypothetical protein
MPEAFLRCQREGGKIYRISGPNKRYNLKAGEWRNICVITKDGIKKIHLGHKQKKE